MNSPARNQLYYGDNLEVLRHSIEDQSVDLVYLDPPFNSSRNYNLLFKQHKGEDSPAQIMAFEDTWQWSPLEYQKFCSEPRNARLHRLVNGLYEILGPSEMMAYVVMMAPRLLELHRVLKSTGTLYLHCDPVASHYLKIILDVVFGPSNFGNEISWRRSNPKGNSSVNFPNCRDVILRYVKGPGFTFHKQFTELNPEYFEKAYRYQDKDGRRYRLLPLLNPSSQRPNLTYEFLGVTRVWRWTRDRMQRALDEGLIVQTKPGAVPQYKKYLDDSDGRAVTNDWCDIEQVSGNERRGYPTQKPLALLERIISASSNPDDVVLDPFAGCGTAVVAAERMARRWIGIDITYLSIGEVIERLNSEKREGESLNYSLEGTPADAAGAQQLFEQTKRQNHKPYEQFAVTLVKGKWSEKRGADRGIDGTIGMWTPSGEYREALIQVKGGNGLTLSSVRDFARVIDRERAVMGLLISQKEPTKEMLIEAEALGFADWYPPNTYPRLQIRSMKDLLESPKREFLFPEGSRVPRHKGVGRTVNDTQLRLLE